MGTSDTNEPRNKKTPYGTVNRGVLRKLQATFEPRDILDAVGVIDDIAGRCQYTDEDYIRKDFFRLHSMAYELCNGGGIVDLLSSRPGETIYDLADDLRADVSGWLRGLRKVEKMLDKLVDLIPEEEWDDEE